MSWTIVHSMDKCPWQDNLKNVHLRIVSDQNCPQDLNLSRKNLTSLTHFPEPCLPPSTNYHHLPPTTNHQLPPPPTTPGAVSGVRRWSAAGAWTPPPTVTPRRVRRLPATMYNLLYPSFPPPPPPRPGVLQVLLLPAPRTPGLRLLQHPDVRPIRCRTILQVPLTYLNPHQTYHVH